LSVFITGRPCVTLSIGRGGARKTRRLIRLISVGWLPPDLGPSGACLTRGTRMPAGLVTPPRVTPHRGGASSHGPWNPLRRLLSGVTGTCLAMAQLKPASSRAMATTTWVACVPRAIKRRTRLHRRTCAFQLMSWMGFGRCASRSGKERLTLAGYREAQAPSPRARRAWVLPALGIVPCRRRSPLAYSEGIRPSYFISWRGVSTRVRSPSSATRVTATVHWTPRKACSASTSGCRRQVFTGSCSACASRGRRSVCSLTARPYA
jgi:hypothetical protein